MTDSEYILLVVDVIKNSIIVAIRTKLTMVNSVFKPPRSGHRAPHLGLKYCPKLTDHGLVPLR